MPATKQPAKKSAKKRAGRPPAKPAPRYSDTCILRGETFEDLDNRLADHVATGEWEPIGGITEVNRKICVLVGRLR